MSKLVIATALFLACCCVQASAAQRKGPRALNREGKQDRSPSLNSSGFTVNVDRAASVPALGQKGSGAPATSVFPYSYNPSWFTSATKPRGCLLVRVQNVTSATNPAPSPSKMALSCVADHPSPSSPSPLLDVTSIAASDVVFEPATPEEVKGTEDPRLAQLPNGTWALFYTAVSLQSGSGDWIARLSLATSTDPAVPSLWRRHGALFPDANGFQFTKSGALLVNPDGPSYLIFGDCSLYHGLQVAAVSPDFASYSVLEDYLLIEMRPGFFDSGLVESGPPPMRLADGNWLFLYNAAQALQGAPNRLFYAPGYVILNGTNPLQVLQRSDEPIVMPSYRWETAGLTPYVVFVEAMRYANASSAAAAGGSSDFVAYYGAADTAIGVLSIYVSGSATSGYRVHGRAA